MVSRAYGAARSGRPRPRYCDPSIPEYNRSILSVELLQIEWELDDEWGESTLSSELPSVVPSTTLNLIYPHRRVGTLPLNGRTRSFFPVDSPTPSP